MSIAFLSVPSYNWCAPLSHPFSCMLVNHGLSQQNSKEEYKPWKWGVTATHYASHAKIMLPTRKPCQDPAGKWTIRRPPDVRKETHTAVVWSYLPFIRSGQNHLARHREIGKKTRRTKEEVGRQHQGKDRPEIGKTQRAVENREIQKTGCKIICGALTTLEVKGLMISMMMKKRLLLSFSSFLFDM